jgi:uncharacterized membrane protein
MIQIAAIAVSIGLIVIGVQGFTKKGLAFSKTTTLTGTSAKLVGVCCILGGIALLPAMYVGTMLYYKLISGR